jgi:hypothetical protein
MPRLAGVAAAAVASGTAARSIRGLLVLRAGTADPGALAGLRPRFVPEPGPTADSAARYVHVLHTGTAAEAVARWNEAA